MEGVHLSFLYGATFTVNLLALVLAIWLGLYLISRNARYTVAWLTAIILWLLAGVFLNVLLAINPLTAESSSPLYLNRLHAGPWYSIFAIALVILTWTCVVNLVVATHSAPSAIAHRQLLVWAALIAGVAGPVSIAGSYFMVTIPMLVISVLEGIPVGLFGWGVARNSEL